VIAIGGLALAGGTGGLPGPFHFHGPAVHAGSPAAVAEPNATPLVGPLVPDGEVSPGTPKRGGGALAATPSATPTSAQQARPPQAMCLRYADALRRGKRPDAELADQLSRAAGGTERIDPYCRQYDAAAGAGKKPHASGGAKRP